MLSFTARPFYPGSSVFHDLVSYVFGRSQTTLNPSFGSHNVAA
jgi:hypothetical protein